jgi:hypothetical protein
LTVQNRAVRGGDDRLDLGFMISPSAESEISVVSRAVSRLARVERCLCLGVLE